MNLYDISVSARDGSDVSLSMYKGNVLLIVNTATACGFTGEYDELEALYKNYKDQGFVLLDFPCNQFKEQAPGSIEEIHQFCTLTYNTTFPRFAKILVNGEDEHPLYTFLKAERGFSGFDLSHPKGKRMEEKMAAEDPDFASDPSIKWNFTKFLVDREGNVVKRFDPTQSIANIEALLKTLL
ncbi:MAG: glutathione peroxidase [Spirochaetia bacterium]|nr:glutathione peroxidase [Spirochaetia bacterium]